MHQKLASYLLLFIVIVVSAGCASTAQVQNNEDPLEGYNRAMFSFNRGVDKALIKPVAQGYEAVAPDFVNIGVTNFFNNLDDVVVIANDLLQFKFEQAVQDTVRISLNTTLGLLGFIDIATPAGLPKNNEDFGQTLGHWGVGEGTFVMLPILGPTTTRDIFRYPVDYYFDPITYVNPSSDALALTATEIIDFRADILPADQALDEALDPYVFLREAYLERRRNLVYDGNAPQTADPDLEGLEDFMQQPDDESTTTQ